MKKLILTAAAGFMALGASVASAATINFATDADTNGERAVVGGSPNLTIDGINMNITADSGVGYLDASTAPGEFGGLGNCQVLNGTQCDPNSDDNVGSGENVIIEFTDGPFDIASLSFRGTIGGVEHLDLDANDQTLLINLNGGGDVEYTFANAVIAATMGAFAGADTIEFSYGGANATEFYVEALSNVPLPGALPLLLSGLAGLGFASRRKRKAA